MNKQMKEIRKRVQEEEVPQGEEEGEEEGGAISS